MVLNVSCDNVKGYFMNLKKHLWLGKMEMGLIEGAYFPPPVWWNDIN